MKLPVIRIINGELRQAYRQPPHEYHMEAGSSNSGEVFEEDE